MEFTRNHIPKFAGQSAFCLHNMTWDTFEYWLSRGRTVYGRLSDVRIKIRWQIGSYI